MPLNNVVKLVVLSALSSVAFAGPGASGHGQDSDLEQSREGTHAATHQEMHTSMHGEQTSHHGAHGHHMESIAGRPGKESEVERTIEISATDAMRLVHEPLKIKDGETVKFVITNKGNIVHEFSIATKDEHREHGKMMMKNPNMHHGPGGPSVTIKPGKTEELIWRFEEAWQVEVACNMPGHYEAGMHSPVTFR